MPRGRIKLAYIVLAHAYPEQLVRLIKHLDAPGDAIFLHIDGNTSDRVYEQIASDLRGHQSLHFLRRRRCARHDFSKVRITFEGLNEIARLGNLYDYIIYLSGQDYPIKTNRVIRDVLTHAEGRSFIEYVPLPNPGWHDENGGFNRIERWYIPWRGRTIVLPMTTRPKSVRGRLLYLWGRRLPKRRFPQGLVPYSGGAYWCLSKDCADYVRTFAKQHPGFMRFFKYVYSPCEMIVQTILLNSPLRDSIVNDNLRYIVWPSEGSPSHPLTLGTEYFDRLMASSALFARKFDLQRDPKILDMIDQQIRQN